MASWLLFRRLTVALGAHSTTLSRHLIPLSSSLLTRCSSSSSFFSSLKLSNQWLPHRKTLAAYSSSEVLGDDSLTTPYLSVLIHCPKDFADGLADALLCFGASSASMDEDDFCVNTEEVCISSIFPEDQDINTCISHAADSIGLKKTPRYEVKIGEHDDWIKKTQESFHPIEIIEGLWVVPRWRTPPLGAAFAVGIDIDAQAITSASQNATLNNIGPEKMQLHLVPGKTSPSREAVEGKNRSEISVATEKNKYDVVVANILLNPLIELADQIVSCAKPGAIVGLSGILCEQVECILGRYSPLLEGMVASEMDGWACVSGRKRSNLDVCWHQNSEQ